MKRSLFAACLLAASASSAFATQVVWQGHLFVDSVSNVATCNSGGNSAGFYGSYFNAVFRPRNVGTNGPDTKLSILSPRSAFNFMWPGKSFGNGTTNTTHIGGTGNVLTYTQKFSKTSIKPSAPKATTQTVEIKATITDFLGTSGCTVTLIGSLGNRPNLDQTP